VAALFNFGAGLPLIVAPAIMLQALQVAAPEDLTFHRMCGLLVVCFGVIYAMIAEDLERYRPQVWIAVVGKIGVFAIFAVALMQGFAPLRAVGLAVGDLAFALAFLHFLFVSSRARPGSTITDRPDPNR
jgi:hypothetical protein